MLKLSLHSSRYMNESINSNNKQESTTPKKRRLAIENHPHDDSHSYTPQSTPPRVVKETLHASPLIHVFPATSTPDTTPLKHKHKSSSHIYDSPTATGTTNTNKVLFHCFCLT